MAPFRVSAINFYKIDLPFTGTLACDQRRGLLIAFPNENILLNSDTSHLNLHHQSECLFSQIQLYSAIRCSMDHKNLKIPEYCLAQPLL